MFLARLTRWIDREWDTLPNAAFSLGLIVVALWLPLLISGRNAFTIALGVAWSILWIGLYGWRFAVFIKRLEVRLDRAKRRARR
jgi:hypothetical protein